MAKYLPYTVEVKTFSKAHDLAEGLCSKLADKGYYAFLYSVKEIDRVCVGRFDTEKKAQITCNASFFAPWGTNSPFNRLPPITSNLLMSYN